MEFLKKAVYQATLNHFDFQSALLTRYEIPAFQPFINGSSAPSHPEKPKLKKGLLPLFHSILLTELTFQYRFFYESHEDLSL